jgi:DNA mismatch repair protein MutL
MGVINVLPQPVINKIAAGEVIERPASVVKELVENALDAQATHVAIEVEDGGRKLIRVTDDGFGMGHEDLALAFASHATSKLKGGDDLFFITTMGFRGEALASVGAVSHARIVSRLRGAVEGGEIAVRGGQPEPLRAKGAPEGTTVEVANLFFNVPARRKFLRTAKTEFAHILELVSRVAVANPGVGFKLVHNGRETVNVHATDERRRRIADLHGPELAGALLAVDSGDGPARVTGFVAPPIHARANAKMQFTYVNSRFVRDRRVRHAIASGYEGLLMRGRYPVVFLFIQIDPRAVDVNVHPTKIEVRFHRGDFVYKTVLNAVRDALHTADLAPVVSTREQAGPPFKLSTPPSQGHLSLPPRSGRRGGAGGRRTATGGPGGAPATPFDRPIERRGGRDMGAAATMEAPAGSAVVAAEREPFADRADAEPRRRAFQIQDSYIVEERPDGLAIYDQHALHERLLFNQILRRLESAQLESQRMLIPAVVRLGAAEKALLLAEAGTLAELGIEVSDFGPDSLSVASLPSLLSKRDATSVMHEILAELQDESKETPVGAKRLAVAKLVACKAAVKAGDRLTESEMISLLDRADADEESQTCPHGRPARILLPYEDLDRQFGRT